jgi:FolB domain-containing protein
VPPLLSITLQGMRFHTLVGVLPHEALFPQPLDLDVTVWLDPAREGAAVAPLDYRELYAAIADAVNATPIGYLEELVQRAARSVLMLGPVARVRIAARKPHVALPGPLAWAEVILEQDRDA